MKDTKVEQLVINKMTKSQFDAEQIAGRIDPYQIYMITDESEKCYWYGPTPPEDKNLIWVDTSGERPVYAETASNLKATVPAKLPPDTKTNVQAIMDATVKYVEDSMSGGGGSIPQATADTLGGVKADPAQAEDTQPVRIGADGRLVTKPGGGGGGGVTDHASLTGRNKPDQHTIGAVTGLQQALDNLGKGTWELIREITLPESASLIEVKTDSSGAEYACKKIFVSAVIKGADDNLSSSTTLYMSTSNLDHYMDVSGMVRKDQTTYCYSFCEQFPVPAGDPFGYCVASTGGSLRPWRFKQDVEGDNFIRFFRAYVVGHNNKMAQGTTFTVWGVRA